MDSARESVRRVLDAITPSGDRDRQLGGLFVNVIGPRGSGKTRTVLSQLHELNARRASSKRGRNAVELCVAYASCCSFGDDPRSLRRVVLEQLRVARPCTVGDDGARPMAGRRLRKPAEAASLAAFGCALASLLTRSSGDNADPSHDITRLLHIVLDDADALRDEALSDVTNWLPALENAKWGESERVVIWIVSTKSVPIAKGRVWCLYVPAPPPALAAEWYNPTSAASHDSPLHGQFVPDQEVAQDAVTNVRRSAFRFFLDHRPFRDSIGCKDLKRLRNFVTESILSRLYGGIHATSANDPVSIQTALNQPEAGASAVRPLPPRSGSTGAEYLFRSLWSEEVVKQAGTVAPSDGALFQLMPFSAQVMFVTCFYCSVVPAAKDNAVLSEAERSGILTARAKRAQLRTVDRGAVASQTVPLTRLRKCYEAIESIAQHAVAHRHESSGTPMDALLGTPSSLPFNIAQHHLTAFERWGMVHWLSNHRNAVHCRISSQSAESAASQLGIDLYQLVPNALTA